MQLPEIGEAGQRKLARARVLLIGLGGLGSPSALYLAAAGVGTLGLADMDTVSEDNLHRQVLYRSEDIGKPKVDAAAKHLQALNPDIRLIRHPQGLTPYNARELFRDYDLILDGSDRFDTRYLVNDAACLEKKPFIYASVFKSEGQLCLFDTARGSPCYRCLHPEPPPRGSVPNCAEAGVLGPLCGWIGSAQASMALRFITQAHTVQAGMLHLMDNRDFSVVRIPLDKHTACKSCSHKPSILDLKSEDYAFSCSPSEMTQSSQSSESFPLEISATEAADAFKNGGTLLDIREPDEWAECKVEGSMTLSMGNIPFKMEELPKQGPLLVLCHSGGRSRQVTYFLRQNGFDNAINVRGGIVAWSREVNPSLPQY